MTEHVKMSLLQYHLKDQIQMIQAGTGTIGRVGTIILKKALNGLQWILLGELQMIYIAKRSIS